METIATFVNLSEAELCKTHLEGSGIPAFIPDEHVARNNWFWITALGGVRLQVFEKDAASARELLAIQRENNRKPLEIIACPKCSGTEIHQDDSRQRFALGLFYLLTIPIPFSRRTYICQKCQHRWKSS